MNAYLLQKPLRPTAGGNTMTDKPFPLVIWSALNVCGNEICSVHARVS